MSRVTVITLYNKKTMNLIIENIALFTSLLGGGGTIKTTI